MHCLLGDSDNVLSDWLHVPVKTSSQTSSVFDFRHVFFLKEFLSVNLDQRSREHLPKSLSLTFKF